MGDLSIFVGKRDLSKLIANATRFVIFIWILTLTDYGIAQSARNILILHSYHQGLQWTDRITAGIQSEFKSTRGEIELHYEYLDTKRNPGEAYFRRIAQFEQYKSKLAAIPFEVIICSDNNALRFILEAGKSLYPDIPVVFCGVNNFSTKMLDGHSNVTGVVESIGYKSTIDFMLKLHPERNHILLILDQTPTGIAVKKELEKVTEVYSPRVEFEYFQEFDLKEIAKEITKLGPKDAIYLLTFNRDSQGNFISYSDGIQLIHNAAKVPIYGSWEFYFGNGIVGGMITSGFNQGKQAAKLAKKILNGTHPNQLPVIMKSPNQAMFDYQQMTRFGISKTDLPSNSQIINLPPPLYERFKEYLILSIAIFVIMCVFLVWKMIVQKREKKYLEKLNFELDQRLDSALSEVKVLSGLLPICSNCKKIRDDKGYWNQIEVYVHDHSDASFSHGICPECSDTLYGGEDWYIKMKKNKQSE
jgi:ABC-type uncharacterized transport system substrate-binding protein